ncbi:MAG: hypothetical protein PHY72_01100 [Candidatus Pacebacteria bacterium]|nr:hypothetical protein [Candidatus Paceibacterota bacterium]
MLVKERARLVAILVLLGVFGVYFLGLKVQAENGVIMEELANNLPVIENTTLLPSAKPPVPDVVKTMNVVLTAYSSSVDETDDTPFTTASGMTVQDGIIANNLLRFGDKIRIPEIFGDKIFVVQDRMNQRKSWYQFDIWMPSKEQALHFGVQTAKIEVVN